VSDALSYCIREQEDEELIKSYLLKHLDNHGVDINNTLVSAMTSNELRSLFVDTVTCKFLRD
jgi:hypothetical protein